MTNSYLTEELIEIYSESFYFRFIIDLKYKLVNYVSYTILYYPIFPPTTVVNPCMSASYFYQCVHQGGEFYLIVQNSKYV